MNIKKLKKKDYQEALKLVKDILQEGFIQRNFNKFLNDSSDFTTVITNIYLDFAEVLGQNDIQTRIDNLLLVTVEGLTKEKLEDLDLDEYIELVLQFIEIQGFKSFFLKAFPEINLEKL